MRTRTKQQPSPMRAATTALALAQATRRATAALVIILLTATTAWAQEAIDGLTYNTTGGYYEINDEQDLIDLATYVNAGNNASGKTFKQTQDITMTGSNFTPIGVDNSDHFGGTYDGGGYTISGLYISYSLTKFAGLFNYVKEGTVRNVILVSPSVTNTHTQSMNGYKVGALIAYTWHCTAENCHVVSPTLKATGSGNKYYGALVGESGTNSDIFTNCCYYTDNASLAGIGESPRGGVSRAYTVTLGDGVTTSTAAAFTCKGTDYYKSGAIVTLPAAPAGYINAYTVNGLPIDGTSFTISADATVALSRTLDPAHFADNGDGTYTIKTATGWSVFCDCLDDNDTYNRFSGKTVRLDADITVTRMAGSDHHDFCGTFDGQGHTLTLDISSDSRPYTAPFAYVSETTPTGGNEVSHPAIRNLNVTGTVNATKEYASGLVGAFWGTLTIENCTSSVTVNTSNKYAAGFISNAQGNATIRNCLSSATINSTVSGDGTHAGFIGVAGSVNLNIEGCAFTGSLLGTSTTRCAGFVGYGGTVTITNSLYAPASVTVDATESATFARGNTPATTNSYYSAALGTAQGKAVRTVTAGDDVTISGIALTGSETAYTVSGITAYANGGLKRGDVLYYGSDDQLSLTLSNTATAPLGYQYSGYTATAGTLSGSTLTMPDADVTVSLDTEHLAPIDWATVNQGNNTDPYMIYNKDQLNLLAYRVNGTHGETAKSDGYSGTYFKLGADIKFDHAENETDDYAENYEAIGSYHNDTNHYFNGIFDGDGYTVSGIRINKTDGYYPDFDQGLFGSIYYGANIHDVHLTDARITGCLYVGGIAGSVDGGTVTGCVVTDSYITVSDYYNNPSDDYGTICGLNFGTLTNNYYHGCTVNGTENATNVGCHGDDIAENDGAVPFPALADATENTDVITKYNGQTIPVVLSGRTLYKDGDWNTLCLPFDVTDGDADDGISLTGTPLEGATVKELDVTGQYDKDGNAVENGSYQTGIDGTTLYLYFKDASAIEAGKPYLVKWAKPDDYTAYDGTNAALCSDIVDPVFTGVTIDAALHNVTSADNKVSFLGNYSPVSLPAGDPSNLYLGARNTLYWPSSNSGGRDINAFRAYFHVGTQAQEEPVAISAFSLYFGDDEGTTGIVEMRNEWNEGNKGNERNAFWYTLDGRRLSGKPTKSGVYINGGRKVVVK